MATYEVLIHERNVRRWSITADSPEAAGREARRRWFELGEDGETIDSSVDFTETHEQETE